MKLIRFGEIGDESPGIIIEDERYDLSEYFYDWDRLFFQMGGLDELASFLKTSPKLKKVASRSRWSSCVARPGKVICIGLNYSDHATESGMPIPVEPIVFQKGSNTVVGPYDSILIPRGSQKTDWEVELGVVIGRDTRYLETMESAKNSIAGYCIVNDLSERAFQLERGGQWTKGKSCDNFTPIGPWLLTADEITDISGLSMSLSVNKVLMQHGQTKNMIFDVYQIIHYLSQFMTLEAGDLILTGTPAGVGLGKKPPVYLKVGDEVELEITGLGVQNQWCELA